MRARPVARDGRDGFTLIETLVAMTVLSLLAAVLLHGAVGLRSGVATAEQRQQASLAAQSVMDRMLSDRALKNGSYKGNANGFAWSLRAAAVDLAGQLPTARKKQDVSVANTSPSAPATGTIPSPTNVNPSQQAEKPKWATQRLVLRLETGGRPLELETIRLVSAP
jgi:prepilin-type N-terminal cleavage/methylation domain-containing protein